ncbi:MAG: riboflavin biosynthesis protein [Myxococcales bacterium]
MRVVRGIDHEPSPFGPNVVTFGNYDGVHRGHQAILARLVEAARHHGAQPLVALFDPHPVQVLRPDKDFHRITTLETRLGLLADHGVESALVIPFDERLWSMEAEDFIDGVLGRLLRARHVVLGGDSRFGRGRRGDVGMLSARGRALGFEVELVPAVLLDDERISSSAVRHAVLEGRVERAAAMLSRPHTLTGPVVRGDGRGRHIGFPTANLRPAETLIPKPGVYEARLSVLASDTLPGEPPRVAVVNVGHRPTFGVRALAIEAHVLDTTLDLYDRRIALSFVSRLRDEQRFDGVDALVAQIRRDVEAVRERAR